MIDVEIRGPLPKKEYDRLKKKFTIVDDMSLAEYRVNMMYKDRGFNNREARLEHKNGASKILIHTSGKAGEREEIAVELGSGQFSNAVEMLAELGYKKGTFAVQHAFVLHFGGATFTLFDADDTICYYEAYVSAQNPTEVDEAKQKLEKLARTLRLPVWSPLDMQAFLYKLNIVVTSVYDYDADGGDYFKKKFGV